MAELGFSPNPTVQGSWLVGLGCHGRGSGCWDTGAYDAGLTGQTGPRRVLPALPASDATGGPWHIDPSLWSPPHVHVPFSVSVSVSYKDTGHSV